ncbi:MAG: hypothetical protein HY815_21540 [Candidatus Riflebacteria bacterium]|nr:hypothetical protein [Candidatus Riflebacteria bacterium]
MSGKATTEKQSHKKRPDPVEEDFEEVKCENRCSTGFKVLMGQTVIVLVCLKCHLEYELTQQDLVQSDPD